MAKPNMSEPRCRRPGLPPTRSAAIENSTSPAMSTISITFCSVFDCIVPAMLRSVSSTTATAAHTAELFSQPQHFRCVIPEHKRHRGDGTGLDHGHARPGEHEGDAAFQPRERNAYSPPVSG